MIGPMAAVHVHDVHYMESLAACNSDKCVVWSLLSLEEAKALAHNEGGWLIWLISLSNGNVNVLVVLYCMGEYHGAIVNRLSLSFVGLSNFLTQPLWIYKSIYKICLRNIILS